MLDKEDLRKAFVLLEKIKQERRTGGAGAV